MLQKINLPSDILPHLEAHDPNLKTAGHFLLEDFKNSTQRRLNLLRTVPEKIEALANIRKELVEQVHKPALGHVFRSLATGDTDCLSNDFDTFFYLLENYDGDELPGFQRAKKLWTADLTDWTGEMILTEILEILQEVLQDPDFQESGLDNDESVSFLFSAGISPELIEKPCTEQIMQANGLEQQIRWVDETIDRLRNPESEAQTTDSGASIDAFKALLLEQELEAIPGKLTTGQIHRFFDFLHEQSGSSKKPFLPKSEVEKLKLIGLRLPKAAPFQRFHLNLNNREKGIIYYCFYKLWECNTEAKNSGREYYARFLQAWFDNFDVKPECMVIMLKEGKPSRMQFDLFNHRPKPYLSKEV
ncbi:MAG: hypothetical protein H6574_24880 [Lewinellaceae bacterium]|nr:hypothetical protein [Saprospiraceae bacterium]MCB9334296.1 hypothetical protein [Lewinellaceae bacterium]